MKRAIPPQAKFAPTRIAHAGAFGTQAKANASEDNRRARASAAGLAIALSVGASGALLPQQGNAAVPVRAEEFDASVIEHYVREGETLWQIAKRYGIEPRTLAAFNEVNLKASLSVGQVLKVPVSSATAPTTSLNTFADGSASQKVSTPEGAIARKQKAGSASTVLSATPATLDSGSLPADGGEDSINSEGSDRARDDNSPRPVAVKLDPTATAPRYAVVETEAPETALQPIAEKVAESAIAHEIRSGETLNEIASAYGVSVSELAAANGLDDPIRSGPGTL